MFFCRKTIWPEYGHDVFSTTIAPFVFDYICHGGSTSHKMFPTVSVALSAVRELDADLANRWTAVLGYQSDELDAMEIFVCNDEEEDVGSRFRSGEHVSIQNRQDVVNYWCEKKLIGQRKTALDIIRDAFIEIEKNEGQEGKIGSRQLSSLLPVAFARRGDSGGGQLMRLLCGDNTVCPATVVACLVPTENWSQATMSSFDNLKMVVGLLSVSQLKDFLRFVISSDTISSTAQILVDPNPVPGSLPTAATCTKTLSVPINISLQELKSKLLVAVDEGLMGGFTKE
jgi:hypothetical protein